MAEKWNDIVSFIWHREGQLLKASQIQKAIDKINSSLLLLHSGCW